MKISIKDNGKLCVDFEGDTIHLVGFIEDTTGIAKKGVDGLFGDAVDEVVNGYFEME